MNWYVEHRKYDKLNGIFATLSNENKSLIKKENKIIGIFSDENEKVNIAYDHFILTKYGNFFRKIYQFNQEDLLKKIIPLQEGKNTFAWTEKGFKSLKNRKISPYYFFLPNDVKPLDIILDLGNSDNNCIWGVNQNTIIKFTIDTKNYQTWDSQIGTLTTKKTVGNNCFLNFDAKKSLLIADENKVIRISRQILTKKFVTNQNNIITSQKKKNKLPVASLSTLNSYQKYSSWALYGLIFFSFIFLYYGFKNIWKTKKKSSLKHQSSEKKLMPIEQKILVSEPLKSQLAVQLMQLNIQMMIDITQLEQLESLGKEQINKDGDINEVYEVIKHLKLWLYKKQQLLNNQIFEQDEISDSLPHFNFSPFLEKTKKMLHLMYDIKTSLWVNDNETESNQKYWVFGTELESYIMLLSIFSVLKKEHLLLKIKKIIWKSNMFRLAVRIYLADSPFEIHTQQKLIKSTYLNAESQYTGGEIVDIYHLNFSQLPEYLSKIISLSDRRTLIRASWIHIQKELLIEWDCKT